MPAAPVGDLDTAIVELVSRGAVKVPPYPAVAMKVQALVRRQDYGLDELTRLVASDQALAADALRCANSPFYARAHHATSLPQAIARIGAQEVARLAIASGLAAQACAAGPLAALKRRAWLESLAAAALAQELAKLRRMPAEEAFVCGLLHDFGKVIAISCVEEILAGRCVRPMPLHYWTEIVDRYHVELGVVLAARWELPPVLSDAISLHHAPDVRGAADPRLVALVQACDGIVTLLDERAWLEASDLERVPHVAAAEREPLLRVLDRLPGFVASFEGGAGSPPAPGSAYVETTRREPRPDGPVPLDCAARVIVNRQELRYRASGIAANHIVLLGDRPLPENLLLRLQLDGDRRMECWATAKLSWPETEGHTVLLQPFALDGDAQEAWAELVGAAAGGAAA